MKKDLRNVVIGAVLGLLVALLFRLSIPSAPPAPAPVAKTAATPAPAKPAVIVPVVKTERPPAVALPTLPPAKVSPQTPAQVAADQAAMDDRVQRQSRTKAILNNLRMISASAQQYLLEEGARSVNYSDLVDYYNRFGASNDNLLRNVSPVMGEDYSSLYLEQSTTQLQVVTPDGNTVTFTQ